MRETQAIEIAATTSPSLPSQAQPTKVGWVPWLVEFQLPKFRALALAAIALLTLALVACTTRPIPTTTLATPTPARTSTPTPTATPTPSMTPTETATPTLAPLTSPTLSATQFPHERNPRAILIEADVWGETLAGLRDAHVPLFRLYGDGFVVFAGANAPLTTGLDAVVRTGRLSEGEIQGLLAYLNQIAFLNLKEYYEPRPKPADAPTAYISVYQNKAKTVSVYAPSHDSTPQAFSDALKRILLTIPADAQSFSPSNGYLQATDAGPVANFAAKDNVLDWTITGVKLADAASGVTISGGAYAQMVALRADKPTVTLFREGDHAYRVRFEPKLPRAVYLSDWLGMILNAPREFDGRIFDIVGYYRGWNLYGEARGNPVTRNDWTIADDGGAMYVTGAGVRGLDPSSRADAWSVVRLRAKVVYVRLGTSYLEASRVENLTPETPTPPVQASPAATATPAGITSADAAIAAVQARFPEMAKIKKAAPGTIGATTDIKVFDRGEGWEIAFVEGWGDCPAGCINNRYYYFSVRRDGRITKVGEYARIYNESTNSFTTSGVPMWGVPR
jgi:hypothetical protein